MRWLIDYLRQSFCKHSWMYREKLVKKKGSEVMGTKVYMRCRKCGYHKKHWKFI